MKKIKTVVKVVTSIIVAEVGIELVISSINRKRGYIFMKNISNQLEAYNKGFEDGSK